MLLVGSVGDVRQVGAVCCKYGGYVLWATFIVEVNDNLGRRELVLPGSSPSLEEFGAQWKRQRDLARTVPTFGLLSYAEGD